jgi:hypothetical protein
LHRCDPPLIGVTVFYLPEGINAQLTHPIAARTADSKRSHQ